MALYNHGHFSTYDGDRVGSIEGRMTSRNSESRKRPAGRRRALVSWGLSAAL